MKLVSTIHVYDALEQVRWTVTVRAYGEKTHRTGEVIYHAESWFFGVGETDPATWVRNALSTITPEI